MARILIGSSNVYWFYKLETFTGYGRCKMVTCTNVEVFKVEMEESEDIKCLVIISVNENFTCKFVKREGKVELRSEAIKAFV
jgi:hypothetical protein